jgi:hypothetical protein
VVALYPDAAVYGAMGELYYNGDIRKLTLNGMLSGWGDD